VLVPPDGPEAPLDRRVMLLPEEIGLMPMQSFSPVQVLFEAVDASGKRIAFHVRQRLFTRYAGGWILPWLCWHLNGEKIQTPPGLRQTINMAARLYRAVDALIAGSRPWTREDAPHGYFAEWTPAQQLAGVPLMDPNRPPPRQPTGSIYFYENSFLGPVLGTIFPPGPDDRRYVGKDGRRYSFYGEPMTGLPAGAVGPTDDNAVDPARVEQAIQQAQIGVFTPAPSPPLANSVLTPPPPPSSAATMTLSLGSGHDIRFANWGGASM
jgi:hypothetical protein